MTKNTKNWLINKYGKSCQYCGEPLGNASLTIDHMQPRRRSGGGHRENLTLACHHCNTDKANRTVEEYRTSIARSCTADLKAFVQKLLVWNELSCVPRDVKVQRTISIIHASDQLERSLRDPGVVFPLDRHR